MARPPSGEDRILAAALARYQAAAPAHVTLGPGHDAAALTTGGTDVVVTTDVLVDGVHFRLAEIEPARAARKALAVNLSDLAAAAATPLGYVVGAVLPRPLDEALFAALAAGFAEASETFGVPCIGGDTNAAVGPLVLAVTAFGRAPEGGALSRAGAAPGMVLSVTGPLGGSLLGRHLDFVPRTEAARLLHERRIPACMMDISDGLALDLTRLCRASGVGARIDGARIPVHPDAGRRAAQTGRTALAHALGDGEDFELLLAHAPLASAEMAALEQAGCRLQPIGEVVSAAAGIEIDAGDGYVPLEATGYDHGAHPGGDAD